MAVGLERAHAEFIRQGEGLLVMGCGLFGLRGRVLHGHLAEEPERIRLVSSLLVPASEFERLPGNAACVLPSPRNEIGLTQPGDPSWMTAAPERRALLYRVL